MVRNDKAAFVIWLCVVLFGCNQTPRVPKAGGTIVVEVVSPKSGHDDYWRLDVVPSAGAVTQRLASSDSHEFWNQLPVANGAGKANCVEGSRAVSPDGRYVALCFGAEHNKTPQLVITDTNTGSNVFVWTSATWRRIDGFVWSPGSHHIAMLTSSERQGTGILDLIWAAAGHPLPINTFYIEVFDIDSGNISEYVVKRGVAYGTGRIRGWTE